MPRNVYPAALITLAFQATLLGTLVCAARRTPNWRYLVVVLNANFLSLSLCAYYSAVGGSAELCGVTLVLVMAGFAALARDGIRGHLLGCAGALLGYPVALASGTVTTTPPAYLMGTICVGVVLTSLVAHVGQESGSKPVGRASPATPREDARIRFADTVAGQLRAPLSALVGYAKLFARGAFGAATERQFDALHRMQQQAQQAVDLLEGMVDFSRAEAGSAPLKLEEFRLGEMLENVAQGIPPAWRKPFVQLDWNVKGSRTVVRSDRRKLEILIRTLVHAVLELTEEGPVTIASKAQFDTAQVHLAVRNHSSPMDAGDLAKIRRFLGDSDGGEALAPSKGLGLDIIRCFTRALAGSIEVVSEAGEGICFQVTVPLSPAQAGHPNGPLDESTSFTVPKG